MNQVFQNTPVKNTLRVLAAAMFLVSVSSSAVQGQLWKKVKERVKRTVENKVTQKSEDVTNNVLNKAEGAVQGQGTPVGATGTATPTGSADTKTAGAVSDYKSYDFVPGDKIIFEPDISQEAEAELPARFKLIKGNAEIQGFKGDKILHLDEGSRIILTPLMNSEAYLPEQFTVEFDMAYENKDTYMKFINYFDVNFFKSDRQYIESPLYQFRISSAASCQWGQSGNIRFSEALSKALTVGNSWHHIAIYINKTVGKVYIDQYRVAASNTLDTGAGKMSIQTDGRYGIKIKNFRLAAGGSDKYNKVITEGKFITHGILFDVAKATIRPSSAGTLNEVAKMMQSHPGLRFEINGHTDSDGAEQANLKLSEARATAVKAELVKMGIAADRLTVKGLGEARPIDSNDTQEGKANNRRVEFIKI